MKIDNTDWQILELLRKDAKVSTRDIAKKLRKPITTVHNRIKKLRQEGVIKNFTITLDNKKLGKSVDAFVLVNTAYDQVEGKDKNQEDIAREIKILQGVEEVCSITGINDLLVRVKQDNIDQLNNFLINKLRKIPGVRKTQTLMILNSIS